MKILAIECSTEVLSVAVYADGEIHDRVEDAGRRHGDVLLPLISSVLRAAGIDKIELHALAFGRGPGAFTGVRMAVAAAQGIAFGIGIPALPISSLAALAQEGFDRGAAPPILALLDARMGELYAGFFEVDEEGLVYPRADEILVTPAALELPGDDVWCALGPGYRAHAGGLKEQFGYRLDHLDRMSYPQASTLARLAARDLRRGLGVPAHLAQPVYLRNKVAQTERERGVVRRG